MKGISKYFENRIKKFAFKILVKNDLAHNDEHTYRIVKLCKKIALNDDVNLKVLIPAAYLHDITSRKKCKKSEDHVFYSITLGIKFLKELKYFTEEELADIKICMIEGSSENYMGGKKAVTKEGKILQDAGILDSIGAVGIARVFSFAGYFKEQLVNPNGSVKNSTFNYIYQNILRRYGFLQTRKGKSLGKHKQNFLKLFIKEYIQESS
jgi:uncharacterized protein